MRTISVDLEVIASNYKTLKSLTDAKVMAIVKADAFGHGIIEVSKKLESIGVGMLATADLEEAQEIRAAGIKSPILAWLHGSETEFSAAIKNDIQIGLSTVAGLEAVAASARQVSGSAKVHLKVDTGLGRNGAALSDWPSVVAKAVELNDEGLVELAGVFSHLSGTSAKDDADQLAVFDESGRQATRSPQQGEAQDDGTKLGMPLAVAQGDQRLAFFGAHLADQAGFVAEVARVEH
jgi:alanine racemase